MSYLFLEYAKCSTCRKAKKFLQEKGVDFIDRPIVEEKPTRKELETWYKKSGLPINKFFNTSGRLYKEMNLKDKVKEASEDELLELLATDGMLVKRPIIVKDDIVLVGFKEEQWEQSVK
ncbi:arsenate reductase [Clostridium cavendishii DSM 21758]|uniref:Arsenate reductase n=1 Tax=Clostridium cavendishii DSM 21758 TaxID=1121302 RepID=A0A1M6M051_9CLOT|nr:arsenate reductase family protein [Clostridium cavendishii]SHJ76871.1 arsenate reductase [Clostridium cavendishii DSM 21758]